MPKQEQAAKGKSKDDRPARKRYRESHRLERRKIRNLMRHNHMTEADARKTWYTQKALLDNG